MNAVVSQLAHPEKGRDVFVPIAASEVVPELAIALEMLQRQDHVLLKRSAAERAICHRLAVYLETEINRDHESDEDCWQVDCEYNLFGSNFRSQLPLDELKKRIDVLGPRDIEVADHVVYPDVIVHKRDTL